MTHRQSEKNGVEGTPGVRHLTFQAGGGPMSVYEAGNADAPAVVLIHGAMADEARFIWDQLFPVLAERYHVFALDVPRHGGSRPWLGHLSHSRLMEILHATFQHLALENFYLIGLSMGGGLSIEYAVLHPDQVRGAVFFEPGGLTTRYQMQPLTWLYLRTPGTRRLTNRVFRRMGPKALRKVLDSLYVGGSRPIDPERLLKILKSEIDASARFNEPDMDDWQRDMVTGGPFSPAWNLLREVQQLQCPTLWLGGYDSTMVRPSDMEHATQLAGPDATLRMFPHAGHLLPLERPAETNQAVLKFLDQCESRHSGAN